MSQFKRKEDRGAEQASSSGQTPDFSALEPADGFSAGQLEQPGSPAISKSAHQPQETVSPSAPDDLFGPLQAEPAQASRPQARPAEPGQAPALAPEAAPEPKKRYYNPGEVMKKKGCIGCGGMILVAPLLLGAIAALAVAVH